MTLYAQTLCLKLVSRNSTATTVSMHTCIVSLLKPWRTLQCGYTPPKRWLKHIKITFDLHHMQLNHPRLPQGNIHAIIRWSALVGSGLNQSLPGHHRHQAKTPRTWQCQPSEHLISSGSDCQMFKSSLWQYQPMLDNAPCEASVKKQNNKVISFTSKSSPLTNNILLLYQCMTFQCLTWLVCQCREVTTLYAQALPLKLVSRNSTAYCPYCILAS